MRVGLAVAAAAAGETALRLLAEQRPDLVLLDVMLPRKSGYEVCEAIRGNAAFQATRIILLTAKGRETEMAKGMALGADTYMTKPFSTKDLVTRVKQMLGA
jgi:DNA-binding response OmpR family regulator